jgi:hypothetical protein
MDATVEIDRLLDRHGAVLIRQNKHLVYRLPNGGTFTRFKTPSDHRAALNELSDLRHALGVAREKPKQKGEQGMQVGRRETPGVALQQVAPAPEAQGEALLKDRIAAAIASEEAIQEKLLVQAQAVERKIAMLKALLPFADDPKIEESLRAVLPAVESPPQPKTQVPAPPPQEITERVQVTRELVFAATQTFDGAFTINNVMDLMTNGRQIASPERTRIRSSIAQSVISLYERGELVKEEEHIGRKQTIWRKAALNRNGNGTGPEHKADC